LLHDGIARHNPTVLDRLAIGVLVLVALIAALTFRDHGLGWDDYTHAQYGDLLLALYTSGFKDTRALSFVNLYLYGGGFDMAAALLAKILPFDLFETRRLLGAAVGLAGLAATWRIARRIGGPLAGLTALLLLATCPLYYGHMFINPKDAPFAAAMAVLLLGIVRAFEEYPRPGAATSVILAIGLGLSVGSRIMAGFGVIAALAALALLVILEARQSDLKAATARLGRFALALVPCVIAAYVLMALVWPWAVVDPLNPIHAIGYFSHFFEKPWTELFGGVAIAPPDMPRRYVPVLLGLQLPEIFIVLGGIGLIGALIAAARPDLPQRRAIYLCVALAGLLPVLVTVLTRPAMYNGIRHFVFVLPPFAVLGGLAAGRIADQLQRYGRVTLTAGAVVLVIGLALPVVAMARLHPYEYAHFNWLAGGVRAAQSQYMLDYWGLALKQAGQALRERLAEQNTPPPAGRKWKVAVCGPHPPAQVALGDRFEPTWEPKGADFALSLGTFYCAKLDAPLMADIIRDGVSFARAYDLRGRTVENLFTIPPVEREPERAR
jgi:4-amino-4-deoxy-L-arabinose transferase-like glycosyltransferase